MVFRDSSAQSRHRPTATQAAATAILLISLAQPGPVNAAGTFYLQYRHWQPYSWPGKEPTAKDVSRSQRELGWRYQGATSTVGLDYDYQPLRIRTGTPAHNGHLHRLTFGGEWQHNLYHLETQVGVAGTSNMFKHQDFHRQVLNGRLAAFRAWHEGSDLSVGVGGDHRFGSFRWLPRLRWAQSTDNGHWLMDLPVLLQWQNADHRWTIRMERAGDRWATLDKSREVESALYLREWRAELSYRLGFGNDSWPAVVLGLGASIDTRVRYQDLDAGTRDIRLGDRIFGRVMLSW